MKLMNKILKKINENFDNYFEIINFSFPVLFCVELEGRTKIGFVNVYQPAKGKISFILANSEYNQIINCIENDTNVIDLFKGDIYKYIYDKGEKNQSMIDSNDINQFLPSEELTVQGAFNYIDIYELLQKLQNQQKTFCVDKKIRLDEFYIALEDRVKNYNKSFVVTYTQFKGSPSVALEKNNYIRYSAIPNIDTEKFINEINKMTNTIDSNELVQSINELKLTGYNNVSHRIKDSKNKEDEYERDSYIEIPDYKFMSEFKRIVKDFGDIKKVA